MSFGLPTAWERLAFFGLCLSPWLLGAWCVSRTGLWIGSDGIVVRGFLRTRKVPLWQARAFVPRVCGWWGNGYPAPSLERIGASQIPIFSLGREGVIWKLERYLEELQPTCDQLNALLGDLQAETGQVPAPAPPVAGARRSRV